VGAEHLDLPARRNDTGRIDTRPCPADTSLREALAALERRMVEGALRAAGGNWAEAARRLGLDRANLHRVARRLGLAPTPAPELRSSADERHP
jgi:anaerobic nitric oxide reductase transcription regulator